MTAKEWKWLGGVVGVVAVIVGCNAVVQDQGNSDSPAGQQVPGLTLLENEFSDAPISPGGTGGLVDEDPQLSGEETRSFFKAFQIDPTAEDTAGPKFVIPADINRDGLLDLVSGWNQSQPVQFHLQQRDAEGNLSFRTINLGGGSPIAIIAGIQVGYINDDEWLDIVVLSKASGAVTLCPFPEGVISALEGEIIVLFSPGTEGLIPDGDAWTEMILVNPLIRDRWIHNQYPGHESQDFDLIQAKPEWGGFTDLAVADLDGRPGDEIVVALNPGICEGLGQDPPINTVDLWINPGPGLAEIFDQWGAELPGEPGRRVPVSILLDAPQVKDIELMDIDDDDDLDIIATYTNGLSWNIRWARNPLIRTGGSASGFDAVVAGNNDEFRYISSEWEHRLIGQVDTAADVITTGDIDNDGSGDVVVRSTDGRIVQWFRRPNALMVQPEFPPNDPVPDRFNFPWQVFTLTEFSENQEPEAIAVGDLTGDGRLDLVAAAEGAVFWYDGTIGETVYDPWFPQTIIQDSPPEETTDPGLVVGSGGTQSGSGSSSASGGAAPGSGVGVDQVDSDTIINDLLVVDLDDDGRLDIVGTLDRRTGSGLSDDRLVWYRNVRRVEGEESTRPGADKPNRN